MANDVARIEKWVRRQLTDPVVTYDGTRKPTAFAVMHTSVGSVPKDIQAIKLGSKDWDPKQLAELLIGIADDHARGIAVTETGSGHEQYEFLCFFSDMPDQPQAQVTFSVKTGADKPDGMTASEPPTAQGMLRQEMRHRESTHQTMQLVVSTQFRLLDMLMGQNTQLRIENHDAVQLAKETILERAASQHTGRMTELEYHRKTEERAALMRMGPPLVNQLLGREIFPQSTVDTSLLEQLIEGIDTEDKLAKLMAWASESLKPEVAAVLAGRLLEIQEKINQKSQARSAMAKQNGAPS
jgi:hypothetical protein